MELSKRFGRVAVAAVELQHGPPGVLERVHVVVTAADENLIALLWLHFLISFSITTITHNDTHTEVMEKYDNKN